LTGTGSDAIMRLEYISQELWIESKKETLQPRYGFQEPLKLELQHFADCILDKKKPLVTGVDGLKALQVAEAALRSSVKNAAVKLKKP
jgi:UDP-N-acetylglucosamine 3-dehydrogenase